MSEQLFDEDDVSLEATDDGRLVIAGRPGFDHASELRRIGIQFLERRTATDALTLDASEVANTSSATISVLLEWLRTCQSQGIDVARIRLSPTLKGLAEVTALTDVFDAFE
ncbi:STAS domain-containing protein [Larsenimonas salina]|uniref:STAS domain-containing protein n=1 Tax=Larsenimonas salina TaxID=1295565 RepID=UPI0020743A51|nr:STAS domain-containing protein [Larsenimonas salina]MCM5703119.1 STAS domain-containing protein [Larsenimonas salina]